MNISRKCLCLFLCLSLSAELVGCGTLIHPERRGQAGGRIDAGIAVLDGIGLLFFIIPGVIAFAVDFSNGTIYLPGGHRHSSLGGDSLAVDAALVVKATQKIDAAYLEALLHERLQIDARIDGAQVIVRRLDSIDEVVPRLMATDAATASVPRRS